jgi:hypothetical protein
MTATPPDDVAAMFDLAPLPAAEQSATEAADALGLAEAILAAELASTLDADIVATDAPDARTDPRVEVDWPARMRLPDGPVIALRVRNVSEAGVGLVSDQRIPSNTVVDFEMELPPPDQGSETTAITGTIKTTYAVTQGSETRCGGAWLRPPAGLDILKMRIERLRR